jgi:hypothetical protein
MLSVFILENVRLCSDFVSFLSHLRAITCIFWNKSLYAWYRKYKSEYEANLRIRINLSGAYSKNNYTETNSVEVSTRVFLTPRIETERKTVGRTIKSGLRVIILGVCHLPEFIDYILLKCSRLGVLSEGSMRRGSDCFSACGHPTVFIIFYKCALVCCEISYQMPLLHSGLIIMNCLLASCTYKGWLLHTTVGV